LSKKDLSKEQINKLISVKNVSPNLKMMLELKEKIEKYLSRIMTG